MKSHQEPLSVVQSTISCSACETGCKVHMRQVSNQGEQQRLLKGSCEERAKNCGSGDMNYLPENVVK